MTRARALVALAFLTATSAHAGVVVTWDCFFADGSTADCAQLEEAFFHATPLVERAGARPLRVASSWSTPSRGGLPDALATSPSWRGGGVPHALATSTDAPAPEAPESDAPPATSTDEAPPATSDAAAATSTDEAPPATSDAPTEPAATAPAADAPPSDAATTATPPAATGADESAELAIVVRSVLFTGGVEYSIDVTDAHGQRVHVVDRVPQSFSDAAAATAGGGGGGGGGGGADSGGGGGRGTGGGNSRGRVARAVVVVARLVGDLQRSLAPFLNLENVPDVAAGVMTLSLSEPSHTAGQARVEDTAARWFVSPTLTGNVNQAALLNVTARAQLDANWSLPEWRLLGSTWGGISYISAPGPRAGDAPQEFGYLSDGADVTAVYSLYRGLSVGTTALVAQAPDQNYLVRGAEYVGVEWVLSPFLPASGGNIGARYVVGGEHQEYVHLNVEKSFEGNFLRHRAVAFAVWHFEHIDVSGAVAASSVLKDVDYYDAAANAAVSVRLINDLSVTLTGSASYRHALINAPDNLNELDPLERFVGGANFGQVNYAASMSLVYVLGNSLLAKQDQRFNNGAETN